MVVLGILELNNMKNYKSICCQEDTKIINNERICDKCKKVCHCYEQHSNITIYDEPDKDKPCMNCEFTRYDSFHDEKYCDHDPPPEDLNSRCIIGTWGTCGYWVEGKY